MPTMSDNSDTSQDKLENTDNICRDFLRNVCKRGKRCKYRHPHPSEARELGRKQEYTFCHDFQNTGCRRPNCKFIHCTREEEEYYKTSGQLPVRLQQAAALGIGVVPNELPLLKGEVPICKDFLKGECKRGSRCKYRHLTSTEYDYELRRSDVATPSVVSNNHTDRYDIYSNDDYENYDYSPLKRKRMDIEDIENNYNHHNNNHLTANHTLELYPPSRPRTTMDYRMLEEENNMLRRKVVELNKQVSDLCATNEVLLEQNARYRTSKLSSVVTTAPPIVTVSQVVTPTITPAPSLARSTLLHRQIQISTTMPQLTLNANSELVMSAASMGPPRLTSSMATNLATNLANTLANNLGAELAAGAQPINPSVSISPQTIVPVSLTMEAIAAATATPPAPPQGSIASVSMSQPVPLTLGPTVTLTHSTPMVSYPIMSHTQLPSSLG